MRSKMDAASPTLFEQSLHGLAHALVMEDHRRPCGPRDNGIEKRDHAAAAVEHGELHRQRVSLTDLHSGRFILRETLPVLVVESSAFDKQAAGDAAEAGLLYQFLIEGIDRVRRTRKLK